MKPKIWMEHGAYWCGLWWKGLRPVFWGSGMSPVAAYWSWRITARMQEMQ